MGISEPEVSVPQFWTRNDGVMVGRYYVDMLIPPSKPTSLPVAEFLFFTNDSGKSWSSLRSPALTGSPFFLDRNTGWYLGKNDPDPSTHTQLYQTTDGGKSWTEILSDCPLPLSSEIHFIDTKTGYATNFIYNWDYLFDVRSNPKPPYFYFTKDGGYTWESVEPMTK